MRTPATFALVLIVGACAPEPSQLAVEVGLATGAAQILFVSGSSRPPAPDRAVINHLEGRGHIVTSIADTDVAGQDPSGYDLVIVASSVTPNDVGSSLRDVSVPVLLWEQFLYDEMRMATQPRTTSSNARNIRIEAPGHPIADGMTGLHSISNGSTRLTFATAAATAQVVATVGGRTHTFAYDAGDSMADGFVAPATRVGIGFDYGTPAVLSAAGWRLFDGAVAFALAAENPEPPGSGDAGIAGGSDAGVADAGGGHGHSPTGSIRVGDEPVPAFPVSTLPTRYFRVLWADMPPIWTDTGNPASRVGWLNRCGLSGRAQIDPIVQPGAPMSMHLHDFFSNPAIRFDRIETHQIVEGVDRSTLTCDDDDDFAAYWVPAVRDNGRDWLPEALHVYYKGKVKPSRIQPIPMGLRIVVGDAHAPRNQSGSIGWWERERTDTSGSLPPNTNGQTRMLTVNPNNQRIVLRLNFPDCWDGVHLYKADGSHMIDSQGRYGNARCPASHPIAIPQVQYFVRYPLGLDGGSDFELASGPWYTFHGDFWNAWDPRIMDGLVRACIRTRSNCRLARGTGQVAAAQRPITIGGD